MKDEQRSKLNRMIAEHIENGSWEHINLLEVDNVCDGGPRMLEALQQRELQKGHQLIKSAIV